MKETAIPHTLSVRLRSPHGRGAERVYQPKVVEDWDENGS